MLYTDGATEAREQLSSPEAARPLFGEDALKFRLFTRAEAAEGRCEGVASDCRRATDPSELFVQGRSATFRPKRARYRGVYEAILEADAVLTTWVTMPDWSSRRLGTWLARDKRGSAPEHLTGDDEGTLSMWAFFSRRLRMWLLLAIALPLTRALVHRLALAAQRRDPSTRTAKALNQADSTVTAVSQRAGRKTERRKADH